MVAGATAAPTDPAPRNGEPARADEQARAEQSTVDRRSAEWAVAPCRATEQPAEPVAAQAAADGGDNAPMTASPGCACGRRGRPGGHRRSGRRGGEAFVADANSGLGDEVGSLSGSLDTTGELEAVLEESER